MAKLTRYKSFRRLKSNKVNAVKGSDHAAHIAELEEFFTLLRQKLTKTRKAKKA